MLVTELCPAGQMSTLVIFIGDWSLYMKLLRNFGYIKMFTGLWSRDRTTPLSAHFSYRERRWGVMKRSQLFKWLGAFIKIYRSFRAIQRALAVYIEVYMKLSVKIQCLFHWIGGGNFRIWWRNGLLRGWGGGGGMPPGKCLNWKAFLLQYKAYCALFVPLCLTSS